MDKIAIAMAAWKKLIEPLAKHLWRTHRRKQDEARNEIDNGGCDCGPADGDSGTVGRVRNNHSRA